MYFLVKININISEQEKWLKPEKVFHTEFKKRFKPMSYEKIGKEICSFKAGA